MDKDSNTSALSPSETRAATLRAEPVPVSGIAGIANAWRRIDRNAETRTDDEAQDSFHIGVRDGFSEAVQLIDVLTGGDGEYRFCTDGDPERHCPTPAEMIARIVERVNPEGTHHG
ncbi:hypothetical protein L7H23_01325 [Sphingopyxis sp. BSN-002]|uniref:hypothetical protein n=1 Tax=Sphingopyxis sp. BSN-002 TaxID=2911495 RepID=UPI001EDA23B4|nr:hypothetical protein [Sphingopyxis sp. BSN-002]QVJ07685.1 hypothetical protein [Sphingopyxis phage VSN-002]UKK84774.1 hypothetical protein L7H23_01325 [Sphingopyxis sp. BSN-002]